MHQDVMEAGPADSAATGLRHRPARRAADQADGRSRTASRTLSAAAAIAAPSSTPAKPPSWSKPELDAPLKPTQPLMAGPTSSASPVTPCARQAARYSTSAARAGGHADLRPGRRATRGIPRTGTGPAERRPVGRAVPGRAHPQRAGRLARGGRGRLAHRAQPPSP